MSKRISRLLAAMTCAASLSVYATEDSDSRKPLGKLHTPSQIAIDSCKGFSEKDTCQFNGQNNESVAGICSLPSPHSETTALSCRPNQHLKDSSPSSE